MIVFGKLSFHILILLFAFYVNKEVQAADPNSENDKNTEHVTDQLNGLNLVQGDDNDLEEEIVFFKSLVEPNYFVKSTTTTEINFEQKVDHFNTADKRTFEQRAYVDTYHAELDGPVVLNIGQFKPIYPQYMEDPTIQFLGQRLRATLYILELRYCGYSIPTDVSTENLEKYNNTEQILADIENFIQSSVDKDKTWIVYGAGYGGTLAAWFRLKYPDVASCALVFAAPFHAMTEVEYKYNVLKRIPNDKKTIFQTAFDQLKEFIQEGKYDELQKKFKMCTKLNEGNLNDNVNFMYWTLLYDLAAIVDNYNLSVLLNGVELNNELDVFAYVINSYYEQDCVSVDFNDAIMKYKNVNIIFEEQIDYPKSLVLGLGTRAFFHQRCKEYGFFDTFGDGSHSFGITIDIDFYTNLCSNVFDLEGFNLNRFNELIDTTNTTYGGRNIQATNVISVVPNIQFWNDIGMVESENNKLIKIDFGAKDKTYMREQYYVIIDTLQEWTSDWEED